MSSTPPPSSSDTPPPSADDTLAKRTIEELKAKIKELQANKKNFYIELQSAVAAAADGNDVPQKEQQQQLGDDVQKYFCDQKSSASTEVIADRLSALIDELRRKKVTVVSKEHQDEVSNLKQSLAEAKENIKRLEESAKESRPSDDQAGVIKKLQDLNSELLAQNETLRKNNEELIKANDGYKRQIESVQKKTAEAETVRAENVNLREQLEIVKQRNDETHKHELEELKKTHEEDIKHKDDEIKMLKDSNTDHGEFAEKCAQLKKTNEELKQQIQNAESLKKKVEELSKKLKETTEEYNKLSVVNQATVNNSIELQKINRNLVKENESLMQTKKDYKDLEDKLQKFIAQHDPAAAAVVESSSSSSSSGGVVHHQHAVAAAEEPRITEQNLNHLISMIIKNIGQYNSDLAAPTNSSSRCIRPVEQTKSQQ